MDEQEKENRGVALNEAARHRLADEGADAVVSNAQKYLKFLQGDGESDGEDSDS